MIFVRVLLGPLCIFAGFVNFENPLLVVYTLQIGRRRQGAARNPNPANRAFFEPPCPLNPRRGEGKASKAA
jgi:hypothetical protein